MALLLCARPGPAWAEEPPTILFWMRGREAEVTAHAIAACGRRREMFDFLDGGPLAQRLASSPDALALAARLGRDAAPVDEDLAVIARWAGAQFVVVVEAPGSTGRARVTLHSRRGRLLATASTAAAGPHDRLWIALERAARVGAAAPHGGCDPDQPTCGPMWFWAAAGTVVLGAVVTGIVLSRNLDGATTERLVER